MTVFKAFLKVLNKNKVMVILYTVILIGISSANFSMGDNTTTFEASKPNIVIVSKDDSKITENFINYLDKNCTIKDIEQNKESLEDALFYRQVNYIIYIPANFGQNFLKGQNPEIEVKATGDYQSSYSQLLVDKYFKIAKSYRDTYPAQLDEEAYIKKLNANINETLDTVSKILITKKIDTDALRNVTIYYNFASYSLLAGCVLVICLITSSFREEKVRRRITISSMSYKKHNIILICANSLFALCMWAVYVAVSFVLLGDTMRSMHGLLYAVNSLLFTLCAVTIAFLISALVQSKNATSGIVNVVALGSAFLCGCFVPVEFLPDIVLKIAHILPTYWFVNANECLKKMDVISLGTLKPVFIDMAVIIGFSLIFVVAACDVSRRRK